MRIARKHVSWYLQQSPAYLHHRRTFNQFDGPSEQLDYIDRIYDKTDNEELAA